MSCESSQTETGGRTETHSLESVWVIIPALNEEQSLPLVLRDLPDVGRVIVVDNGSTDETAVVAAACGAHVVSEAQRGYGAACLRGLAEIPGLVEAGSSAPSVVAFVDADYSDHPDQLRSIVDPILRGRCEFVLGSRLLGRREPGAMPPQSIYGNKLACFLMRLLLGSEFTDLGPFRAMNYRRLCQLGMADTNYGWTIEMQIKAVQAGVSYLEVPVPYRKRIGSSKISGTISGTIKAGTKILLTVAKYGLLRSRPMDRLSRATASQEKAAA